MQFRAFNSFNDFIPHQNVITFNAELSRRLTFPIFQAWITEIRSHRMLIVDGNPYPLDEETILAIDALLANFERIFFMD